MVLLRCTADKRPPAAASRPSSQLMILSAPPNQQLVISISHCRQVPMVWAETRYRPSDIIYPSIHLSVRLSIRLSIYPPSLRRLCSGSTPLPFSTTRQALVSFQRQAPSSPPPARQQPYTRHQPYTCQQPPHSSPPPVSNLRPSHLRPSESATRPGIPRPCFASFRPLYCNI